MRNSFLPLLLLLSSPLQAVPILGANVWYCSGSYFDFRVAVAYSNVAQHPLGYQTVETFDFGDGTSAPITLTATELHPGPAHGWYLAEGSITHTYALSTGHVAAGLETCCRLDGTLGTFDLNNRRAGTLRAKVDVDLSGGGICPNSLLTPPVIWLSGGLDDTFVIPMGLHDHDPFLCRFAGDAEAGGGANPDGMTIDPETCQITWTPATGDPAKLWTTQVQEERFSNLGTSLVDFVIGLDPAKPVCRIDHIDPGPPARLHIFVQDVRSGIAGIAATQAQNASITLPPFPSGEVQPLDVVATKINASQGSQVELRVTDTAGNVTNCDPIFTEEIRAAGKPVSHTYPGVPAAEHRVTVTNGDPGLKKLEIEVNGHRFQMKDLEPEEERTLDVASAVTPGVASTFVLTAHGRPGGQAAVLIWDGN